MRKILLKRLRFAAGLLPLAIMSVAAPVHAWTRTPHAVVGWIAEAKLKRDNPAVWQKVKVLLGDGELYDEAVAKWADDVRTSYPNLAHSVRIPVLGTVPVASDPACIADSPQTICADKAIAQCSAILHDASGHTSAERLEALKFILHLVGDLHQPLHGTEPGGAQTKVIIPGGILNVDAGGNAIATDIHSVWDYAVAKRHLGKDGTANTLGWELWGNTSLNPPVGGMPRDWAVESRDLAKKYIFLDPVTPSFNDAYKVAACGGRTGIACPSTAKVLPTDYETRNYYLVSYRLKQAGLRLADVLTQALTNTT